MKNILPSCCGTGKWKNEYFLLSTIKLKVMKVNHYLEHILHLISPKQLFARTGFINHWVVSKLVIVNQVATIFF